MEHRVDQRKDGEQSTKRQGRWVSSWEYFYCAGCPSFYGEYIMKFNLLFLHFFNKFSDIMENQKMQKKFGPLWFSFKKILICK